MPLTVAARNLMLEGLRTAATTASLHTADPGGTGASEVAGGTYARQPITWNAAASGALDNLANPAFPVPAGVTVTHWGLWQGTTFLGGGPLTPPEVFAATGTYTLTDVDVTVT